MSRSKEDNLQYGEPLTYDKNFKAPIEKRSCTDVICLLIFIVFLGCWGFVGWYAFTKGDLNKLLAPTDSFNKKCGMDSKVLDKPYLFFFDLKKCIDPVVTISGCATPQVCVKTCPTERFVFEDYVKDVNRVNIKDLQSKLICIDDIEKEKITSVQEARQLIKNEKCVEWYEKSHPILKRCMWEFSSSVCDYIPSYNINRRQRDADIPEYKINITHKNENLNNVNLNLEPPFSALSIGALTKSPESFTYTPLQEQKKTYSLLQEEKKIECKIRQQQNEEVIMKKLKRTENYLGRFIGNLVAHFYNGKDADELGQELVEDIINSWVTVLVALILAMVTSLIFIVLMKWLAAVMVWISILGVLAGLAIGIYFSVLEYIYWRDTPHTPIHAPNLAAKFKNWSQDKNVWLTICILVSILFVFTLLLLIFLRKRIQLATALIKEGSKAVGAIMSSVFFPIFPWILQIATIAFTVVVGMHLASIGEPNFKVIGKPESCRCTGEALSYEEGKSCVPKTFRDNCAKDCAAGCYFDSLDGGSLMPAMHTYNVIGFLWLMFFISAFGDMVLAAAFATWFWTFHKADVPFFTLTRAFGRTVRYHLGTVAFGSLLITICRIIRLILEWIDAKLKKFSNPCAQAILCCMKCFFWCLENFLRYLNKNAYIMCAIHGKNFCTSAKDAFNLLMRNVLRVVTVDKVTELLFFCSKLLITAGVGAGTYFYVDNFPEQYKLHHNWVPTAIVVIGTYLIARVFFGVYSMAVDTLFLCFLEDSERNDGSIEKPFFMSRNLMKVLGKRNEAHRFQYR